MKILNNIHGHPANKKVCIAVSHIVVFIFTNSFIDLSVF